MAVRTFGEQSRVAPSFQRQVNTRELIGRQSRRLHNALYGIQNDRKRPRAVATPMTLEGKLPILGRCFFAGEVNERGDGRAKFHAFDLKKTKCSSFISCDDSPLGPSGLQTKNCAAGYKCGDLFTRLRFQHLNIAWMIIEARPG